jgi:integral membrane protein (TIGR01906 family)
MKRPPIIMRHPKPVVPRTLVALFSAALAFLILYTALISILGSASMYEHITDAVLQEQNSAVLDYITGPLFAQDDLTFLTAAERSHMTDVKRIFDAVFIISLIAIGLMLGVLGVFSYNKWWAWLDELLGRSLRAAGWTILGLLVFLAGAAILDFTKLWALFHLIVFPQGNWMFPVNSTLITLYPNAFFQRFVMRWLVSVSTFGAVAVILSYVLEHMRTHEAFFSEHHAKKKSRKR